MKIVELVCQTANMVIPKVYTIGAQPMNDNGETLEDSGIVESITYFRHAYNKGFQGDFPCYMVAIADTDVRVIIPVTDIARVHIDIEKGKKAEEAPTPALPE